MGKPIDPKDLAAAEARLAGCEDMFCRNNPGAKARAAVDGTSSSSPCGPCFTARKLLRAAGRKVA